MNIRSIETCRKVGETISNFDPVRPREKERQMANKYLNAFGVLGLTNGQSKEFGDEKSGEILKLSYDETIIHEEIVWGTFGSYKVGYKGVTMIEIENGLGGDYFRFPNGVDEKMEKRLFGVLDDLVSQIKKSNSDVRTRSTS